MAGPEASKHDGLFSELHFAIVRSSGIDDSLAKELHDRIVLHGGNAVVDGYPETRLNLDRVTYIISTTSDFPDYHDALKKLKSVVQPRWIDMSIATNRLSHTQGYSPDPHLYLADVIVTCAELPRGDREAIAGGIIAAGGNYTAKLTTQVTHVIALNTENDKCKKVLQQGLDIKMVLPHWFDNCLRLGRKIDEAPYQLPNPTFGMPFNQAPRGPSRQDHLHDATWPIPKWALSEVRDVPVLKGRKFFLEQDLQLSPDLRSVICAIIEASKGEVVHDIAQAQILVCKYRHGQNYVRAELEGLHVGSLSWLYWLIHQNLWTSPYQKLLHYPLPKMPLPGFAGVKIALSNYCGDARVYVESLIIALGAEFTKQMAEGNDYLVTGHLKSQKVDAAREWNVEIVNHLWLEESFVQWKKQPITNPRYTCFPDATNLGEVVGQAKIDRQVVYKHFVHAPDMPSTTARVSSGHVTPGSNARSSASAREMQHETLVDETGIETPGLSVRPRARAAKLNAATHLHEMTEDMLLYEKERKRVGGVTHGRERKSSPSQKISKGKRSAEPDAPCELVKAATPAKRRRLNADEADCQEFRLLVTGYKPYHSSEAARQRDTAKLQKLGIDVTQEPSEATIVAAPKISRTPNFLCAIAHGVTFVDPAWFLDCMKEKTIMDPSGYTLEDQATETEYDFTLQKSLKRAKKHKQNLLSQFDIYWTRELKDKRSGHEEVAKANGCALTVFMANNTPSKKRANGSKGKEIEKEMILLSEQDIKQQRLWTPFQQFAESRQCKARIVEPEWLTRTALCQRIEPLENHEFRGTDET